jgi:hypothetical protein
VSSESPEIKHGVDYRVQRVAPWLDLTTRSNLSDHRDEIRVDISNFRLADHSPGAQLRLNGVTGGKGVLAKNRQRALMGKLPWRGLRGTDLPERRYGALWAGR